MYVMYNVCNVCNLFHECDAYIDYNAYSPSPQRGIWPKSQLNIFVLRATPRSSAQLHDI